MSFLYRHGLLISRKQPYLDWANGPADGEPLLSSELSQANRTLYLVPEVDGEPDLAELIAEYWADIFENELSAWIIDAGQWPEPRTREMFDAWFDVEINDSVFDLAPEEPLTQADIDEADLSEMMGRCASCGLDIGEGEGRLVGFKLNNRDLFAPFEGRVMPLRMTDDPEEDVLLTFVTAADSEASRRGDDLVVRVCSSGCEKAIRSRVPKALRRWSRLVRSSPDDLPDSSDR